MSTPTKKVYPISIHSLRGEGDLHWIKGVIYDVYFNPLPPWGGRRFKCLHQQKRCTPFQSTPSVGRETSCRGCVRVMGLPFQSTPSVGRETTCNKILVADARFQSTPSVGRETLSFWRKCTKKSLFQSTPSVGRETGNMTDGVDMGGYFNPLPPWGGRLNCSNGKHNAAELNFNPLPPWGGRPHCLKHISAGVDISIHSLRGEGDSCRQPQTDFCEYFNPLPPWGGRHTTAKSAQNLESISIHSLRGEGDTHAEKSTLNDSTISIHSLRGEGDDGNNVLDKTLTAISIHSLRGEGDGGK